MLNKSVRQSVCGSPYVPNAQFLNKLCLCWFRTLSCAGLGLLWALRVVRSIPRGLWERRIHWGGKRRAPGLGRSKELPVCHWHHHPAMPRTQPRHPGRAQLLQLHPIPSMEPSQKYTQEHQQSLQQPRHRTNASQGFVITTPHG